jgi:hypothetical protein
VETDQRMDQVVLHHELEEKKRILFDYLIKKYKYLFTLNNN